MKRNPEFSIFSKRFKWMDMCGQFLEVKAFAPWWRKPALLGNFYKPNLFYGFYQCDGADLRTIM